MRFEKRLEGLADGAARGWLSGGLKGLERECLRVAPDGDIAHTPHPRALGSALTNPYITTDYSEALLELITPPIADVSQSLEYLRQLHRFVHRHIADELLWAASMPCVVSGEQSIPIARYGTSNSGMMKHVYRVGLGHRYGKVMQVIAGVHFNYSPAQEFWPHYQELEDPGAQPSEFVSRCYFGLIRNLQRFGWLVLYLFGASPAVCKSFLPDNRARLEEYDASTLYLPFATSLRMSDIGYKIQTPPELQISYDGLDSYVASLGRAIETPYPPYERIGVEVDGEWRQLNANFLQIENEYYATMRAKQVPEYMEKPVRALASRGVRYVELRSVDVNPFEPLGVAEDQLRFLEAFLLYCLLEESPLIDDAERGEIDANQLNAAREGRRPGLRITERGVPVDLAERALKAIEAMKAICGVLDAGDVHRPYSRALAAQEAAVRDPTLTLSARVLAQMKARGEGFFHFAQRLSEAHRDHFRALPESAAPLVDLDAAARRSIEDQREREATETLPFAEFLQRYFAR